MIADLESGRLLGEPKRVISESGVICEHNCLSLSTADAEMKAVAAQNVRVKNPVYHVILSWPTNELPTSEQAFACGTHALTAIGMAEHQYVFALHQNTENVHLHIAVNRVHPDSFASVYPERDYFKLDRAMRELELRYGWQHDHGPYAVFEKNGVKVIDWRSQVMDTKGKRPTPASDMERHADQESLFSYARKEPKTAVLSALKNPNLTWQQLHQVLAKYGLALREKGQGFAIYDLACADTTPIKASDMHEALSKTRLTQRLGPFQATAEASEVISTYDKYREPERDPHQRTLRKQERADARRALRARYNSYRNGFVIQRLDVADVRNRYAALRAESKRRREEVRSTIHDPKIRKAMYSVIAFESLLARDRLRREIQEEREALKSQSNQRQPYREWVEKQAVGGDAAAISQLRGWDYRSKRSFTKTTEQETLRVRPDG
jgi:hypothetical protein